MCPVDAFLARRVAAALTIAFVLAAAGRAHAAECLPLRPRNPDGNYIIPGALGDIVYRRVDGVELALDAYVQRPRTGRRPLVIVVHGGGWTAGSRVAFVGQFLETLTEAGFNWVAVDYRLGGLERYADAVDDLAAAVAFVRCHADALDADPDRLILLGEDAGAHLAALLASRPEMRIAASVLVGGFYEVGNRAASRLASPLPIDASPILSPAVPAGPVLAVHGSGDTEVPTADAAAYCTRVTLRGGSCERLIVAGASHRAENWWPRQWGYKRRLIDWLVARTGEPGPHRPIEARLRKRVVFDAAERLTLDLWLPDRRAPVPLVLIAHGGGWEAGDRVTYVTPLLAPLARAGLAWASIDYRLTPQVGHRSQIADVRTALAYIRRHAKAWNVDPARIVLLGESASAQMVLMAARDSPGLAGVVSFYGVYDLEAMVTDASPRSLLVRLFGLTTLDDEARRVLRAYSPIHHVSALPPVLLVHGTSERLWEQGVAMKAALDRARVPSTLVRLDGAPHGMESWEGVPVWQFYKARVVEWITTRTRHVP